MTMQPTNPETTAVIKINPEANVGLNQLFNEVVNLKKYAIQRKITKDEDLSPVTNDLSIISGIKKQLKVYQDEYTQPIKGHLAAVMAVFNMISVELDEADKTNRSKINAYREAQKKRVAEAEELNRQSQELARKQAEFSGTGEYTVDTTPLVAPAPVKKVSTSMGTVSTQVVWKWVLVDIALVSEEYKILDDAKITRLVKAGQRNITGIRIYSEDTTRVNTRRSE